MQQSLVKREPFPDRDTLVSGTSPLYLLTACSVNLTGEIIGFAVDKGPGALHGNMATPKPATDEFSTNEVSGEVSGNRPVLSETVRQLVQQRMHATRN
jgi:hypothetical protein